MKKIIFLNSFVIRIVNSSFVNWFLKYAIMVLIVLSFDNIIIQPRENISFGYSSMIQFENDTRVNNNGFISTVSSIIKIMSECLVIKPIYFTKTGNNKIKNVCIPDAIGQGIPPCNGVSPNVSFSNVNAGIIYTLIIGTVLTLYIGGFYGLIPLIATLGVMRNMINVCLSMYVLAPYEYINLLNGRVSCSENNNGTIENNFQYTSLSNAPLTKVDIPWFYTCTNNGSNNNTLSTNNTNSNNSSSIPPYGYMGGTQYCSGPMTQYAVENLNNGAVQVGTMIVRKVNFWGKIRGKLPYCPALDSTYATTQYVSRQQISAGTIFSIDAKDNSTGSSNSSGNNGNIEGIQFVGYYTFDGGHVKLCAMSTNTILPMRIGCTSIPPPYEVMTPNQTLMNFVNNTRCSYFLTGRSDLFALGSEIETGTTSGIYNSVGLFLQGDFHILSTTVGCIEDALTNIFINPANPDDSFLKVTQQSMSGIFYAVISLYLAILGLKMFVYLREPSRGEALMYFGKIVIAVYFGIGNIWFHFPFSLDNQTQNVQPVQENSDIYVPMQEVGLYSFMLGTMSEIANIFMQSTVQSDPMGFCYYDYNGKNLLSQRKVPATFYPTQTPYQSLSSKPFYQMTVWDLIDCVVAVYLNFGSCKYNTASMLVFMFFSASFLASITGFMLAIISFIYICLLFTVIFKFVHATILAMFIITVLVVVAPIMMSFYLFDYTKEICEKWAKMLVGYTLYPGFLFAFIALMIVTLDSVFYGIPPSVISANTSPCLEGQCININNACNGISSIFCVLTQTLSVNGIISNAPMPLTQNCQYTLGSIMSSLSWTQSFIFFNFTILDDEVISSFFPCIIKMMLFSLVFYFFSGSVISFIESLVGVSGLNELAQGDLGDTAQSAGSKMMDLNPVFTSLGGDKKKGEK